MYSCSADLTSSISFVSSDLAVTELDFPNIVSSIHEAIRLKCDGIALNDTSAAIEIFSKRLHREIQQGIQKFTVAGRPKPWTDWESELLRPLIATFNIEEPLGVCEGDAEYILLLSATLLLAFELLVLLDRTEAGAIQMFVALALNEYFVEPGVCVAIDNVLKAERVRLGEGSADAVSLRAIEGVRQLLPDHESCVAAWKATDAKRVSDAAASSSRTPSLPWTPSETSKPTAVFVQVYLKFGKTWSFPFFTSVHLTDGTAILNSSTGLTMQLEPTSFVSPDISSRNTMLVKASRTCIDGFVGTVIIPPDHLYPVTKVCDVSEKAEAQDVMRIDTEDAILEVCGDDYVIKRKDSGSRAVIENSDTGIDWFPRFASPDTC